MTVSNQKTLTNTLVEFLHRRLIYSQKDGVLIQFDGSLMSLVNYQLARLIQPDTKVVCVAIITNQNKFNVLNLKTLAEMINSDTEMFDATNYSIPYQERTNSSKRRLSDMILGVRADRQNLVVLGNLCYSQWCINFPDSSFKNPEHIYLLNRLFYNEVKQLARYLKISDTIVDRKVILDYEQGKSEKDILGFSFDELELFINNSNKITTHSESLIAEKLVANDKLADFVSPIFQRPCSFLT